MSAVSDRVKVSIIKEAAGTPGTTPTNPKFRPLRLTGAGIKASNKHVESKELDSSRKLSAFVFVGRDAGGSVPFEWISDAHDDLVEGAMMSAWVKTAERNGAAEITACSATAGSSYTVTNVNVHFAQYHLIRASGFANAANNRLFAAATGTTSTNIAAAAGGAAETPAGETPRVKQIGFEGPSGDITAGADGLLATVLSFANMRLTPGQWLKIGSTAAGGSFANVPANNGYARVSLSVAVTAGACPLDIKPAGWGVDNGAGKLIRVYTSDVIFDGVTRNTYTFERIFEDLAVPIYEHFRYAVVNRLSFDGKGEALVEGSAEIIAKDYAEGTAALTGATYLPVSTKKPLNGASDVAQIMENGISLTSGANVVQSMTLDINNNARKLLGFGQVTGAGVNFGRCRIGGRIPTYLGDDVLLNKGTNSTATSIVTAMKDPDGNSLVFDAPKVQLGGESPDVGGQDEDVVYDAEWRALKFTPALSAAPAFQLGISQFEEIGV